MVPSILIFLMAVIIIALFVNFKQNQKHESKGHHARKTWIPEMTQFGTGITTASFVALISENLNNNYVRMVIGNQRSVLPLFLNFLEDYFDKVIVKLHNVTSQLDGSMILEMEKGKYKVFAQIHYALEPTSSIIPDKKTQGYEIYVKNKVIVPNGASIKGATPYLQVFESVVIGYPTGSENEIKHKVIHDAATSCQVDFMVKEEKPMVNVVETRYGEARSFSRSLEMMEEYNVYKDDFGELITSDDLNLLYSPITFRIGGKDKTVPMSKILPIILMSVVEGHSFCFEGDPGTGKTRLLRRLQMALAMRKNEVRVWDLPASVINDDNSFHSWRGMLVPDKLNVVCIDQFEAVDTKKVSELLAMMDGNAQAIYRTVFVLAKNEGDKLPPAFYRPNRLQFVKLTTLNGAQAKKLAIWIEARLADTEEFDNALLQELVARKTPDSKGGEATLAQIFSCVRLQGGADFNTRLAEFFKK